MANALRVTLEIGPKGKQVAAVAPDWPGLERGAKTGEAALERVHSCLPRYASVAQLAGMEAEFAACTPYTATRRTPGSSSPWLPRKALPSSTTCSPDGSAWAAYARSSAS